MSRFVRVTLLAGLLGLVSCQPVETPESAVVASASVSIKPDIVLVTLDTTRRDAIGCYGQANAAKTPNLDALCREGQRFDQAIASAPVTLPAHASIMTGQYPARHGARYNGNFRLADEASTLAERLTEQGYRTGAFVSAFVLEHRFGLKQGFAVYDDNFDQASSGFALTGSERNATGTTDAALTFVGQIAADQPMALWVHYFDAHAPYQGQVDADDPGLAYRAEIESMDAAFGRLRAAMTQRGRPVIWWVLADHGEGLGDHGERTHGLFVYDSTVHIPMWLSAPGLGAGQRDDLAAQVDVLPTTLGLLGLAAPDGIDGIDLLATKRDANARVFVETALPYFDFGIAPLHAMRGRAHKYIAAPKPEFFDLTADAAEATNLVEGNELTGLAAEWSVALDGYLLEYGSIDQASPTAANADAAASERLRSLGYLSGSDMGLGQLDPKDAVALVDGHSRAVEFAGTQRYNEGIDELDRVLIAYPGARAALYLRARLLAATGQYVAAEADAKAINARHPDADSVLLAAQLALLLRRPDDARALLTEATRLDPDHGGALVVLGDLALQDGQPKQAQAYFRQALDKDGGRIGRQVRARLQRLEQSVPGSSR